MDKANIASCLPMLPKFFILPIFPPFQPIFKRSPCPGYAIDIGPSGLAFLVFLTLILKLRTLWFWTLNFTPQFFGLIQELFC
jgi:hypothetical protein